MTESGVPIDELYEERAKLARDLVDCAKYKRCSFCPWCVGPPENQECLRDVPVRAIALGMLGNRV